MKAGLESKHSPVPQTRHILVRMLVAFVITVAVTILTSTDGYAQSTSGSLRGRVQDPSAAMVAGADVIATNEATGVSVKTVTTSAGTFAFPNLLPGIYTVHVEASGFARSESRGIPVLANQVADSKFSLKIGDASQSVEVTADAETVQTTTSTISSTFNSAEVSSLPNSAALNGDARNLAVFAPGVVAQPGGVAGSGGSVGGNRPRNNNFNVDGVDDNNVGTTGYNSTVIPDAVQEFDLQTNQFSAEYGHSAGGQFNLVTKTGGNNWHGSGEWYMQNRNLNALDNLTKQAMASGTFDHVPRFDNNRFGGTFGGPIIKNKWFIFGAYEYTDIHGEGNTTSLVSPTAAGLQQLQVLAANPAVVSRISSLPIAPAANQGTIPVNGTDIPVGDVVLVSPLLQREHDYIINSDYTTGRHRYGARYLYNRASFIVPVPIPQTQFNQSQLLINHKASLIDTWSITNQLVNDAHLSYSRYSLNNLNQPGTEVAAVTLLDLGIVTQGSSDAQNQTQNTYQIIDNLSWHKGRHNLKFGGEYRHYIDPQFFLPRSLGDYQYKTTQDLINDVVPTSQALRGAGSGTFLGTQTGFFGFVQDDLKLTPRFTVNVGLRYEYWTNPVGQKVQTLNSISNVPGVIAFRNPKTDKNNFMPRIGFAWDLFGDGKTALRGGFGVSYDVKFQNFASISLPPQFATELNDTSACTLTPAPSWCATGKGFLAGGGLPQAFLPPTTQADARALTSSFIDDTVMPKILTWSLSLQRELYRNASLEIRYLGTRGLSLPVQDRLNFISAFDAGFTPLPTFLRLSDVPAVIPNAPPQTMEDFVNFSNNTGPFLLGGGSNTLQQFGFFGNVTSDPPKGSSTYHGMSVNFTQKTFRRLFANVNYTWSHTLDNGTNEFNTSSLNPRRAQDTNRLSQDWSNSDLDVRHKLAFSVLYTTPNFATSRWASAFVNGFGIGSTFLAQTGQPVTVQSGLDANANSDAAGDRAILNPAGAATTGSDAFTVCRNDLTGATQLSATTISADGSCATGFSGVGYVAQNSGARFIVAGPGSQTNVGRNSVRSPGFGLLNLSLTKDVRIGEGTKLQLRSDFFNVLNHRSFTIGNGNISSTSSIPVAQGNGQYVQVADAQFLNPKVFSGGSRQTVLGLKLIF